MSSPRPAAKPAKRTAAKSTSAKRRVAKAATKTAAAKSTASKPGAAKVKAAAETGNNVTLAAEARQLAAEIERALAAGQSDALPPQALQALMGALSKLYAAQVEAGSQYTPVVEGQTVSPTAIMLTASGLLRAANLAVFELGMWQSWTGR